MGEKREESVDERAQRLLITARMPKIWVLSALLVAFVALMFGVLPLVSEVDRTLSRSNGQTPAQGILERWSASVANPGPISQQHKLFAQDCGACHQQPFAGVTDGACLKCHSLTKHGHVEAAAQTQEQQASQQDTVSNSGRSLLKEISHATGRLGSAGISDVSGRSCVSCHMEHQGEIVSDSQATGDIRGAGPSQLSVQDSRLCTDCHGDLKGFAADTKLKDVKTFAEHPAYEIGADTGALKLNHAVHLKAGLRGPLGEETLKCSSCHHPEQDGRLFKAVSYQKDCARCHPLTFDPDLPERQAPHGAPEEVLQYVFGEYAKLAAFGGEKSRSKGIERLTDGSSNSGEINISEAKQQVNRGSDYDLKDALNDALKAEKLIFTKTSCVLCHQVNQRQSGNLDAENKGALEAAQNITANNLKSNYQVVKPNVRQQWLSKARFDHSSHQTLAAQETFSCQGCHAGVKDSQASSDVLIPEFSSCANCHGDKKPSQSGLRGLHVTNGLNTSCVSCHGYHQSQDAAQNTAEGAAGAQGDLFGS